MDYRKTKIYGTSTQTTAMNYWIITVAQPHCDNILRGLKTMEVRRRVPMGITPGDVIFIVRKGGRGHIVGACQVTHLTRGSVLYFWICRKEHGLSVTALKDYAGDAHFLVGIGLKKIRIDTWCLTCQSFGFNRSPQWFYKVRPEYQSTIDRVLK